MNTSDDNQTVVPSTRDAVEPLLPLLRRYADRLSAWDQQVLAHFDANVIAGSRVADKRLAQICAMASHLAIDLEQVFLRRYHDMLGRDTAPDLHPSITPPSSALH